MKQQGRIGTLLIRIIRNAAGMILITAAVIAIAVASYALFDLHILGQQAQPHNYEKYKPGEDHGTFEEFAARNEEVIGWIDLYGTNVDYPVVQAQDNEKYLMTAADGSYSLAGAIFLDYRNHPDFSDFNNIIYGHSMSYNAMFGDICDYSDRDFYDAHLYGDLFFDGAHHGLAVVGFVEVDAYQSGLYRPEITSDDQKEAFLAELDATAKYPLAAADRSADNTYVLLSTCTSDMTNGRDILICRLTDEVYADPYGEERGTQDTVEGPRTRLKFFIIVMVILLILVMAVMVMRRVERRMQRRG